MRGPKCGQIHPCCNVLKTHCLTKNGDERLLQSAACKQTHGSSKAKARQSAPKDSDSGELQRTDATV